MRLLKTGWGRLAVFVFLAWVWLRWAAVIGDGGGDYYCSNFNSSTCLDWFAGVLLDPLLAIGGVWWVARGFIARRPVEAPGGSPAASDGSHTASHR